MHDLSSTLHNSASVGRRDFLKTSALAAGVVSGFCRSSFAADSSLYVAKNGRINQSVVPWCYNPMPMDELIRHAADMGLKSVELIKPEHWPTLKKYGLVCALTSSHGFVKGFAHREEHAACIESLRKCIDITADAGFPSVITFSGFRRGIGP